MEGDEGRRRRRRRREICANSVVVFFFFHLHAAAASRDSFDYGEALTKSLLYFEAQRSGHLPHDQRVTWRGHSGLTDGLEQGVDLVGGYYDAGDHVKFGLPMAFTMTMLSWSVVEYGDAIASAGELKHALEAIKWGTDYFIKAHARPNLLWAEVGDGDTDHDCWQRPEDMTTSRKAYKIDRENPGSEVAAETAAAMAAASIVFRESNPHYSHLLLHHAQQLFEFGDEYRGNYDVSIPAARSYYASVSGYGDELLWAAAWLHRATGREEYRRYVVDNAYELGGTGWAVNEFSWDIKFAGVQILVAADSKLLMEGQRLQDRQKSILEQYKARAQDYVCSCLNMSSNSNNVGRTPGGLLFVREWNNMQYVASAAFLLTVYSDYLAMAGNELHCAAGSLGPSQILSFVKAQVDYMLGSNPLGLSYLVGFGSKYPKRVHHRAASTISHKVDKSFIGCVQGYDKWFVRQRGNPYVLIGALVGGPNAKDQFKDTRDGYMQTEACTYNTAPMVGVFAKFHQLERHQSLT